MFILVVINGPSRASNVFVKRQDAVRFRGPAIHAAQAQRLSARGPWHLPAGPWGPDPHSMS